MEMQKRLNKPNLFLLLATILGMSQLSDSYAATASSTAPTLTMEEIGNALGKRYYLNTSPEEKTAYKEIMDTLKQESRHYASLSGKKGITYFRFIAALLCGEIEGVSNNLRYTISPLFGWVGKETNAPSYAFQGMLENIENLLQIASLLLDNGAQIHDKAHQNAIKKIQSLPGKMDKLEKEIQGINEFRTTSSEERAKIYFEGTLSYAQEKSERLESLEVAMPLPVRKRLKTGFLQLKEKTETVYQSQLSKQQALEEGKKESSESFARGTEKVDKE